ncbi:MAG: carbohydrate kinase [Actinomycetaceae bacterium]|nr:carbohydrate kinase [Actinomycetaceae bacterium]
MGDKPVIMCLGEALIDVVHRDGTSSEHVGGSLLNVANVLGEQGVTTLLTCWIGPDERGDRIEENLASHHVSLVSGSREAPFTSVANAEVDSSGHATYTFDVLWDAPDVDAYKFDHLHTGSLAAMLEPGATKVRQAMARHSQCGTVSFDPNARPHLMGSGENAREVMEAMVSLCDIVKVSDEDLEWLYGNDLDVDACLDAWLQAGPSLVVITRGAQGAIAGLKNGEKAFIPATDVTVADTVGAGDSFMGGLLAGLADIGFLGTGSAKEKLSSATMDDIAPALKRASVTSGLTVSHAGAYAPTRAETEKALA